MSNLSFKEEFSENIENSFETGYLHWLEMLFEKYLYFLADDVAGYSTMGKIAFYGCYPIFALIFFSALISLCVFSGIVSARILAKRFYNWVLT